MQLQKSKVSTRLLLAFSSVLALLLTIVAVALFGLAQIQRDVRTIVEDKAVQVRLSTAMQMAVSDVINAVPRIALLAGNTEAIERERQGIAAARGRYDAAAQQVAALAAGDDASRAKLAAIEQALVAARPLNNRVIELSLAGSAAEARDLMFAQSLPASRLVITRLQENIAHHEQAMATAYAAIQATQAQVRNLVLAIGVLALLLALVLGLVVSRSITRQLGGEPHEAAELAHRVAAGDLSTVVRLQPGDRTSMMAQLKAMQESLSQVVSKVRSGSAMVASASAEIAMGTNDLSSRTEEQAAALEQTSASMLNMHDEVHRTAVSARKATDLAQSASQVAQRGGEVVGQVVQTMRGINESSRRISDIIGVIDGIAFQTNILALNAAVEAARAGEHGRGFAVVASEVRSLAGRSAEAAKEIKQLISNSVEKVDQGTQLVDQAGTTMSEIVQSIQQTADLMKDISATAKGEDTGIQQVSEAITQMDQVTQQNAALVEQSAAAAASLEQMAQELVDAVSVFKLAAGQGAADPARASKPVRGQGAGSAVAKAKPPARAPAAAPAKPMPAKQMPAPAEAKPNCLPMSKGAAAAPVAAAGAPPKLGKSERAGADEWESF